MLALFLVAFANCFVDDPPYDWPCPESFSPSAVYKGTAIINVTSDCWIEIDYCSTIDMITGEPGTNGGSVNTYFNIYIHDVRYVGDCECCVPMMMGADGRPRFEKPAYEDIINAVASHSHGVFIPKPCTPDGDPSNYTTYAKIYNGGCYTYVEGTCYDPLTGTYRPCKKYENCNPGAEYYCVNEIVVCMDFSQNPPRITVVEEIPGDYMPECEGECEPYCD